jgi:hypothetical protein
VTVTADTPGVFEAGGFLLPFVDGFRDGAGEYSVTVSTGSFTVR